MRLTHVFFCVILTVKTVCYNYSSDSGADYTMCGAIDEEPQPVSLEWFNAHCHSLHRPTPPPDVYPWTIQAVCDTKRMKP